MSVSTTSRWFVSYSSSFAYLWAFSVLKLSSELLCCSVYSASSLGCIIYLRFCCSGSFMFSEFATSLAYYVITLLPFSALSSVYSPRSQNFFILLRLGSVIKMMPPCSLLEFSTELLWTVSLGEISSYSWILKPSSFMEQLLNLSLGLYSVLCPSDPDWTAELSLSSSTKHLVLFVVITLRCYLKRLPTSWHLASSAVELLNGLKTGPNPLNGSSAASLSTASSIRRNIFLNPTVLFSEIVSNTWLLSSFCIFPRMHYSKIFTLLLDLVVCWPRKLIDPPVFEVTFVVGG